jgi:hypothetical protein
MMAARTRKTKPIFLHLSNGLRNGREPRSPEGARQLHRCGPSMLGRTTCDEGVALDLLRLATEIL